VNESSPLPRCASAANRAHVAAQFPENRATCYIVDRRVRKQDENCESNIWLGEECGLIPIFGFLMMAGSLY